MVADKSSNDTAKRTGRVSHGTSGTLAYLRRIRTYLWIGLVNPGPPAHDPRRARSRSV